MKEKMNWKTRWTIKKWATDEDFKAGKEPFAVNVVDGNILLNEGIGEMLDLLIGAAATTFSNANAMLGVGNSSTASAATQTGLIGASKLYKAMEATYPQRSGQMVTFRSVFADAEANFAWNEFSVSNATDDTGINLNRKVQNLGTKASGTWTLDLEVTIS